MSLIFLTGHRGFIGRHLLHRLLNDNHCVETDIRMLDTRKYDVIIHLAATTHIGADFDPKIYEDNVILSKKIMSTPYKTIYASSCSAAHLTNPYAYSKRYLEWLGRKHGNALGLRFHNVYGNGGSRGLIWYLMNQPDGAEIVIRGRHVTRDYIHVDDCVDEIMRNIEWNWEMRQRHHKVIPPADYFNSEYEPFVSVLDVGTGVGTETLDVVLLYQKLSGKTFVITFDKRGDNEPVYMVSNNPILSLSLEEGLLKTINGSK